MAQELTDEQVAVLQKKILISEIFGPTLQGEGASIGVQTMFVRFAGCDYRCGKCDSLHAVLPSLIKQTAVKMTAEEIQADLTIKAGHCRTVTFSGGNPALWDASALASGLRGAGWQILVETQGTLWKPWLALAHHITISPKGPGMEEKFEEEKFVAFLREVNLTATPAAIKIVIFDQRDIEFAKNIIQAFKPILSVDNIPVFLSLGNPWPPEPANVGMPWPPTLEMALLERMRVLWLDIMKEPLLTNCRFLPQMHTLLWANNRGK